MLSHFGPASIVMFILLFGGTVSAEMAPMPIDPAATSASRIVFFIQWHRSLCLLSHFDPAIVATLVLCYRVGA